MGVGAALIVIVWCRIVVRIYMKIMPDDKIDIDGISDDRLYEIVAFLVDRDAFIKDIKRARESFGFKKPLTLAQAKKWVGRKTTVKSLPLMGKEDKEISSQSFRFSNRIRLIREKHHIGENFSEIVKYAVLSNTITDTHYHFSAFSTTYPFSYEFKEAVIDGYLEQPTVVIFVSAETTQEEVNKLMETEVKDHFKELGDAKKVPIRIMSDIREVRRWYWLKKGTTYPKLHDLLEKEMGIKVPEYNTMIKSIQRYKRKLL
jgi:hypothetical protein